MFTPLLHYFYSLKEKPKNVATPKLKKRDFLGKSNVKKVKFRYLTHFKTLLNCNVQE